MNVRRNRSTLPSNRRGFFSLLFGTMLAVAARGEVQWAKTEMRLRPGAGQPVARVEFPFRNAGASSLSVQRLAVSCDCVTARSDKTTYAPGEGGVVIAELPLAGREGPFEVTIAVTTQAESEKTTQLRAIFDLPLPVTIAPRLLMWRQEDASVEKEMVVTVTDPATTRIDAVQYAERAFLVRLENGTKPGEYRVKVKPVERGQLAQATIRLSGTVDGQPRIFVLRAAVQ